MLTFGISFLLSMKLNLDLFTEKFLNKQKSLLAVLAGADPGGGPGPPP